jgi:hypothetical protein
MVDTINVAVKASWENASTWSGTLKITLVNNTGIALNNPEIKIQLGQNFNALQNTGLSFTQSGTLLTGFLSPYLASIPSGASVTFSIGASFPAGDNTQTLPGSYWINGHKTSESPSYPDTTKPSAPRNLTASGTTANSVSLRWEASTDNVGIHGYQVRYTAGSVSKTVNVSTTSCTLNALTAGTAYSCNVMATDTSNNQSDWSETIVATTLPQQPSTSVSFAPYIDVTINANWNTVPPQMNTRYISDALGLGVRKFYLAFLVLDTTTNQLMWGNTSFPYSSVAPLCNIINQADSEAVAAFGGAAGTDPSVSFSLEALTNTYLGLKKDFGITRIDFDFETPGMYNYAQAFQAARNALDLAPDLAFSLTLPVATTGLTQEGINMLTRARQIGLPLTVQIMAMDYGTPGIEMGDAAISAIEGTKTNLATLYPEKTTAELYAMIAVIPMLGQNDSPGEMFSFQDATRTAQYAHQKGLDLVSVWSLARDFPGMGDLATCSRNPAQTQNYEYTTTFLNALK